MRSFEYDATEAIANRRALRFVGPRLKCKNFRVVSRSHCSDDGRQNLEIPLPCSVRAPAQSCLLRTRRRAMHLCRLALACRQQFICAGRETTNEHLGRPGLFVMRTPNEEGSM